MPRLLSKRICSDLLSNVRSFARREYHYQKLTTNQIQQKRTELFEKEVKRQNVLITDVEKIQVHYEGLPEKSTLIMNKDMSTPYNCAQHINNQVVGDSVLAEVDGEPWDMFRPLTTDCKIRLLHFKEADPFYVNKAFWRSLSFMLGSVVETAFNDSIDVQLCSFPSPNIRSGSFVYDVALNLDSWSPSKDELRVFSADMVKLALSDMPFQRLEVDASVALNIFEDNKFKKAQIPLMAAQSKSGNTVIIYRVGDFYDISKGPMMGHTRHMGKCTIASVHQIKTDGGPLYRFQGIALPKDFMLNHFSYSILEDRARKLNPGRFPSLEFLFQQSKDLQSQHA